MQDCNCLSMLSPRWGIVFSICTGVICSLIIKKYANPVGARRGWSQQELNHAYKPTTPFSVVRNQFWYFTQELLRTIEPLDNNRKWVWYVYKQHNILVVVVTHSVIILYKNADPFKFGSCKNFATTLNTANALGLGAKTCSRNFTLNNTYRFLIIFFVNIKKEKSI